VATYISEVAIMQIPELKTPILKEAEIRSFSVTRYLNNGHFPVQACSAAATLLSGSSVGSTFSMKTPSL